MAQPWPGYVILTLTFCFCQLKSTRECLAGIDEGQRPINISKQCHTVTPTSTLLHTYQFITSIDT